jgi:GNAT superfamily N-acetyltransferase
MEPESRRAEEPGLPEGYVWRAPPLEELDAVVALIAACELADEGNVEVERDDVRGSWERERFSLEEDAWAVETPGGTLVAYADVWPREDYRHIESGGYVHPGHRGLGIGRWLVRTMAARARELARRAAPGAEVLLRSTVFAGARDACELFESEGFARGRHFWRMVIDLREPTPAARWPEGASVRTFEPGDEATVHELVQEAFSDNYRNVPTAFADWRAVMMERESFDPSLWFLAVSGGKIVGAALCPDYANQGWVRQLGVAREWRGRGVGTALLREAFREFARRGKPEAGLVVDSFNRSGAQEFYLSVGMRIEREHQEYELVVGG